MQIVQTLKKIVIPQRKLRKNCKKRHSAQRKFRICATCELLCETPTSVSILPVSEGK